MKNFGIQIDAFSRDEELEGKVFELFEKSAMSEFKSHVQFVKADNLREAEDKCTEIDPCYWRSRSVRPVTVDYVWDTFVQLHYSYSMAKSTLGLDKYLDD